MSELNTITLPSTEELKLWFANHIEEIIAEDISIVSVPAPSWDEEERAIFLEKRFKELGLKDVFVDDVYNVIGILPGKAQGPKLLLAAHLDTVFPRDTDLTVRREGTKIYAPGIRDNSFGVTSLIWLLVALKELQIELPGDLICVATAGEEGLGDLKGMKAAMERFHKETDYVIAVDGGLGGLTTGGITSRRHRVTIHAEGGHSYGAFGNSSAIHSLGKMIAGISELQVPQAPRTTFNVGVISGGNSVNSIASSADMLIDMRSEDRKCLLDLEERLFNIIKQVTTADSVSFVDELLGDRPGGQTPEDHPFVQAIIEVQSSLGINTSTHASSTDANVPMSYGIPAVCMGCAHGGNAHRTDEWLETTDIDLGMTQLVQVVAKVMSLPKRV